MDEPLFDAPFRASFGELLRWRRDVRHFRTDPVAFSLIQTCLDAAQLAPSVGNSQPWRWVRVTQARAAVRHSFEACNAEALARYAGDQAADYARLKLAGLREAPEQFAVFTDSGTAQGHHLGRLTMPETLSYSTVGAIQHFWLTARSLGLGVGWVSILDPVTVTQALDVPDSWHLTAYLCVGWPREPSDVPELERRGWQDRTAAGRVVIER
ncbi:5,6-dimethylbenzimidazole synthase [Lacibacterium aquatile]|uniref:5,6-dimethylbenzimidazole synthase n=1 Tax=Lacibacterium aquatile TaxID=1168082 RepID=A0ABW5DY11_9PROT